MAKLPENWTQHVAPTGHLYYYNSVTEESTYEKPTEPKKTPPKPQPKKQKIETLPKFKYELPGSDWILVFTNKGTHFFHDTITGESHWRVDDEELQNIVNQQDKKAFLLLIAKTRGLKIDEAPEPEQSREITEDSGTMDIVNEPLDEASNSTDESEPEVGEKQTNALVGGYSSSDDDTSDEEEVDSVRKVENKSTDSPENESSIPAQLEEVSSDEENGLDLAELNDISSDEDQDDGPDSRIAFLELLESSSLDVFGAWEAESLKIINDTRFYEVATNKERKQLFDEWVKSQLEEKSLIGTVSQENESISIDDPPTIRFFKFISDQSVVKKPFFFEFKASYQDKLNEFRESVNDREQEKWYKEFFHLSSKTEDDKVETFKGFLSTAKVFKRNLLRSDKNSIEEILSFKEDDVPRETLRCYETLSKIEQDLDISESIKSNPKYWIIQPREKIILIQYVVKIVLKR